MNKYTVHVPENVPKMTLGTYVSRALPLLGDSAVRAAFAARDVKMNGARCARDVPVQPGAEVTVFTAKNMVIPVVYEDEHVLVLNKPAGVSTDQDSVGSMTVLDWAVMHAKGAYTPRMCHRLDNQTCGLIVLAKDDRAEAALKNMFAARTGRKEYHCVVCARPQKAQQVCSAYLSKDAVHGRVRVSAHESKNSKPIVTEYEVIEGGRLSLLRVVLHTGRTHQIRAHMAYLGYPLLGDDLYGNRAMNKLYGNGHLMLCSTRLVIDTQGKMPEIDGIDVQIPHEFDINKILSKKK